MIGTILMGLLKLFLLTAFIGCAGYLLYTTQLRKGACRAIVIMALIGGVFILGGCAHQLTEREELLIAAGRSAADLPEFPDSAFDCGDEPGVPARKPGNERRTSSQVAGYIESLRGWGNGCKDKLEVLEAPIRRVEQLRTTSRAIPPEEKGDKD